MNNSMAEIEENISSRNVSDRIMWFSMWFLLTVVTFGAVGPLMMYHLIRRRNDHLKRIAKLNDANLTNFVSIYKSTDEIGKNIVIGGYGVGRGELLQNYGITYGYKWGSTGNTTLRMGTNRIQETENDSALENFTSDIIIADFDGLNEGQATIYESTPACYDSGGGWFIKDSNEWKVAGLSRGVEHGGANWFRNNQDPNSLDPDYFDAVRISSYAQWIKQIIQVDFAEFAVFANNWQRTDCNSTNYWCDGADFIPHDGTVDWDDLTVFADYWLTSW